MSGDQNVGRSHRMWTDNSGRIQILGNNHNVSKFYSGKNQEQSEVRECLLSFGAESLVLQVAIRIYKDQDIQNYNFAFCFVWL